VSIIFKKFEKKFIKKKYINWLNDKYLMRYSDRRFEKHTPITCLNYLRSFKKTNNYFYAILDSQTNEHIGNITAIVDVNNSVADIGILIGKRSMGYGKAAWSKMMNILFDLGIRKVTGGAMNNNLAMIKIFKSSGMQFEYKKIRQYLYKKKYVDLVGYCKFR